MKKSFLLVLLLMFSFGLIAQSAVNNEARVEKLMVCVFIMNSHFKKVENGEAVLSKRIKRVIDGPYTEYIVDENIKIRRSNSGQRVNFSINSDTKMSGTLFVARNEFILRDSQLNKLKGNYSTKKERIEGVSITDYSKSFIFNDVAEIESYLKNIGCITGALFLLPY